MLKRIERMQRRHEFDRLQEAIGSRPLNPSAKSQFLARIIAETVKGTITAREARKLARTVEGRAEQRPEHHS